jgi:hypothetical protein
MDVLLRASITRKKVTLSVAKNRERGRKAGSPVRFATKEDSCCDGQLYFSSWLWLPQFLAFWVSPQRQLVSRESCFSCSSYFSCCRWSAA